MTAHLCRIDGRFLAANAGNARHAARFRAAALPPRASTRSWPGPTRRTSLGRTRARMRARQPTEQKSGATRPTAERAPTNPAGRDGSGAAGPGKTDWLPPKNPKVEGNGLSKPDAGRPGRATRGRARRFRGHHLRPTPLASNPPTAPRSRQFGPASQRRHRDRPSTRLERVAGSPATEARRRRPRSRLSARCGPGRRRDELALRPHRRST